MPAARQSPSGKEPPRDPQAPARPLEFLECQATTDGHLVIPGRPFSS